MQQLFKDGKKLAEGGELLAELRAGAPAPGAMNIGWKIMSGIQVRAAGDRVLVIGVVPDQIITSRLEEAAAIEAGMVVPDIGRDILKICVFERHRGTGNVGVGFIRGFGLHSGALASTVAHDSHNLMVVGTNDEDILAAARAVEAMGGGQVVVKEGETLAELPLDIAGLMSSMPLREVADRVELLRKAARALGCSLEDPFMTLSFMALPVIPELKMTDCGLFDVASFSHVPLFV